MNSCGAVTSNRRTVKTKVAASRDDEKRADSSASKASRSSGVKNRPTMVRRFLSIAQPKYFPLGAGKPSSKVFNVSQDLLPHRSQRAEPLLVLAADVFSVAERQEREGQLINQELEILHRVHVWLWAWNFDVTLLTTSFGPAKQIGNFVVNLLTTSVCAAKWIDLLGERLVPLNPVVLASAWSELLQVREER
eukprot:m.922709 g.922709  ORF g.922709 m.922709 type:complete len:192 (+) comp101898_c0_seq1:412-987(+)